MTEKYTEILVLVHPVWDLLQKLHVIDEHYRKPRTELSQEQLKERERFDFQLKHTLQAYGEEILKRSKNPNTFFIMYFPKSRNLSESESLIARDKLIKRFVSFCEEKFKGRNIISSSSNFEIDFPRSLKTKFNKELKLVLFGEYGTACVNGANAVLKKYLERNNHEVNSRIITEKTLFWEHDPLLKKGKLNLRVEPLNTYRELKIYRQEKREKGKLPIKPKMRTFRP